MPVPCTKSTKKQAPLARIQSSTRCAEPLSLIRDGSGIGASFRQCAMFCRRMSAMGVLRTGELLFSPWVEATASRIQANRPEAHSESSMSGE
jgi:hypothetical protein